MAGPTAGGLKSRPTLAGLQPGDLLHTTREASVQFQQSMMLRLIRVHDWATYDGWVWLDGYQINAAGDAVERRSIFVQRSGLHFVRG
ncbi:hypothetical protein AB0B66_34440 [Catellatospora sp. NPDC049111]|uniref:hypothetical protein n=1 Tax=Catellatospora sp. NPDC049111 TaxID=3155271 RepID=UPI0033E64074